LELCDIQHNPEIEMLMHKVHEYMGTMGAITHDEEHALYVARLSVHILKTLGYPEREQQLAEIAGYLHDIGNVINRYQHGISGALLAFDFLRRIGSGDPGGQNQRPAQPGAQGRYRHLHRP
jgi:hypothetical protein